MSSKWTLWNHESTGINKFFDLIFHLMKHFGQKWSLLKVAITASPSLARQATSNERPLPVLSGVPFPFHKR